MTVIKTWCAHCGEVDLIAPKIHLRTFGPIDSGRNYYEFTCPTCLDVIQRHANGVVVHALRNGKVPETRIDLPVEMLDIKRVDAFRFSGDELLDFLLEMRDKDFLAD